MRILLTGASSFTGYWFAEALSSCGHNVIAPLRGLIESYNDGVRAKRVRLLANHAEILEDCPFGSPKFMQAVKSKQFDVLCHHAAQVGDYRSADFDIGGAVDVNTLNLRQILATGNVGALVLTGSVFEQNEGAGDAPLRAFSPYGISKGLTAEIVKYRCQESGTIFGKFVIPNPFGPFEEPRFGAYLMRTWTAGDVASVNTPAYIRDNIHVGLLARAYVKYVEEVAQGKATKKLNPSGYVESQWVFAQRFARELSKRMGLECGLESANQTEFPEPVMRVNTDPAERYIDGWDETKAWDEIAQYYQT